MKNWQYILGYNLVLLVLLVIVQRQLWPKVVKETVTVVADCPPCVPDTIPKVVTVTDVKWDTMWQTEILYDGSTEELENIKKDYFSVREYTDTLQNDSSLFLCLNEKVQLNRLTYREYSVLNRRPVVYTKEITRPPKGLFYVGGSVTYSKTQMNASVGFAYKTKKDQFFTLTNNVVDKQPNFAVGFFAPLNKR